MDARLRSGERTLGVTLAEDADGLYAVVDGREHRVRRLASRAVRTADGYEATELQLALDGRVWRAFVVRTGDRLLVSLDGRVHAFGVGDAPRRGASATGVGVVAAPMPGKIVNVLVAVGDAVEAGHPLVVLEAMKMETTLRAEVAGTVAAVSASPGAMVEAGAALVEITPPPIPDA